MIARGRALAWLVVAVCAVAVGGTLPSARSSCRRFAVTNGRVRILQGLISRARVKCLGGYRLFGDKDVLCSRGRWSTKPVCVKPAAACNTTALATFRWGAATQPQAGVLRFHCVPGFHMQGADTLVCNGHRWNGTAPVCRSAWTGPGDPPRACNLTSTATSENLCGWTADGFSLQPDIASPGSRVLRLPDALLGHQERDAWLYSPEYDASWSSHPCLRVSARSRVRAAALHPEGWVFAHERCGEEVEEQPLDVVTVEDEDGVSNSSGAAEGQSWQTISWRVRPCADNFLLTVRGVVDIRSVVLDHSESCAPPVVTTEAALATGGTDSTLFADGSDATTLAEGASPDQEANADAASTLEAGGTTARAPPPVRTAQAASANVSGVSAATAAPPPPPLPPRSPKTPSASTAVPGRAAAQPQSEATTRTVTRTASSVEAAPPALTTSRPATTAAARLITRPLPPLPPTPSPTQRRPNGRPADGVRTAAKEAFTAPPTKSPAAAVALTTASTVTAVPSVAQTAATITAAAPTAAPTAASTAASTTAPTSAPTPATAQAPTTRAAPTAASTAAPTAASTSASTAAPATARTPVPAKAPTAASVSTSATAPSAAAALPAAPTIASTTTVATTSPVPTTPPTTPAPTSAPTTPSTTTTVRRPAPRPVPYRFKFPKSTSKAALATVAIAAPTAAPTAARTAGSATTAPSTRAAATAAAAGKTGVASNVTWTRALAPALAAGPSPAPDNTGQPSAMRSEERGLTTESMLAVCAGALLCVGVLALTARAVVRRRRPRKPSALRDSDSCTLTAADDLGLHFIDLEPATNNGSRNGRPPPPPPSSSRTSRASSTIRDITAAATFRASDGAVNIGGPRTTIRSSSDRGTLDRRHRSNKCEFSDVASLLSDEHLDFTERHAMDDDL